MPAEPMFPYFPQPYLEIGPFRWYAFSVLAGAAIVTGYWIVLNRSQRLRMPHPLQLSACVWVMAWGILAAHLAKVLLPDPALWLADPQRLLTPWRGVASFGGLLGGLAGCLVWFRMRRIPWREAWQWLDIVAYAFPFAWMFGRLGCALAHDHPGRHTTSWLGVRYPGGPRYDLGLVEFLFTLLLAGLFLILDRRRRADGFYFALLGTLYGGFRLWLDTLHVNPPRMWGVTLDQIGAGTTLFVGVIACVVVRKAKAES